MAKFGDNDLYGKEFPIKFQTFEQWEDELEAMDDSEYRDFIAGQAKEVSPWTL